VGEPRARSTSGCKRITTRGLADSGPGGFMTGGTLAQWFDVIVHRQEVHPAVPI